jgi:hypothetical protein
MKIRTVIKLGQPYGSLVLSRGRCRSVVSKIGQSLLGMVVEGNQEWGRIIFYRVTLRVCKNLLEHPSSIGQELDSSEVS